MLGLKSFVCIHVRGFLEVGQRKDLGNLLSAFGGRNEELWNERPVHGINTEDAKSRCTEITETERAGNLGDAQNAKPKHLSKYLTSYRESQEKISQTENLMSSL